ncbi:M20/M25/M40 family metallo-hydrolase [Flaviaesturariibacter flavus]|uniref:M20/M25/M40 family metallo-hydrolase n=1 Tax=Flaviaesturariibacter flavus TaxID=2502780 RepID=A0A4V2NWK4_9BACT|nr:M20/M25/M40 family metallo-hydrolase [Flaviaesturariibacter flavus]TCJ17722.1 M20/M25/M40 family metallo-hydrolase [Flaviaesturariibacter flavus]
MTEKTHDTIFTEVTTLLRQLIATPSFSREEDATAALVATFLEQKGIPAERYGNNIIARSPGFRADRPTWLLNSHHDTVKPAPGYTRNPFSPDVVDDHLYGLGSNDAGASLVALLGAFLYFYGKDPGFNLVFAATAEEEISGAGGISSVLAQLGAIDGALVGEPTGMQLAVAERGLVVIDALAKGRAGHAARNEGESAILNAMADIARLQQGLFDRVSPLLGPVSAKVTVIETDNKAHNVVPDTCRYVIDVRVNELYTLEEAVAILRHELGAELRPRSLRLRSSVIADSHPLVRAGKAMGRSAYGSPTLSDKALLPFPALKIGPGDSARSHTADEYILLSEIREAITLYIELLKQSV